MRPHGRNCASNRLVPSPLLNHSPNPSLISGYHHTPGLHFPSHSRQIPNIPAILPLDQSTNQSREIIRYVVSASPCTPAILGFQGRRYDCMKQIVRGSIARLSSTFPRLRRTRLLHCFFVYSKTNTSQSS
jgi:hypothetical protein